MLSVGIRHATRLGRGILLVTLIIGFSMCVRTPLNENFVGEGMAAKTKKNDYERYRKRRERLAQRIQSGVALLMSGKISEDHPFAPDPDFYYLTGVDTPDAVLVLWPDAPRASWKEVLFLPPADPLYERWNGPRLHPDENTARQLKVTTVLPNTHFDETLGRFLRQAEVLWVISESRSLDDPPSPYLQYIHKIQAAYPALTIKSLSRHLDDMRRVKDEEEIKAIRQAIKITGAALERAMRKVRPGMYEYELQGLIEYEFRRRGARFNAFPTIIAAGPRSTILHYNRNDGRINEGDLIVMDVGARFQGYCADITRTIPASGRFTREQARYYRIVLEAQQRAIEAVRPGVKIRDVIHKVVMETFNKYKVSEYFPHGTSHYLGLEVHDVGDYNKPLEPGVVITVEPGLYFSDKGFGIRIEDDVLVTEDGHRVLSDGIPKTIEAIESIMAGRRRSR